MTTTPGDIVLTGKKNQGIISLAIKVGEKLRRLPSQYSHSALIVGTNGEIVEAQASGVRRSNVSHYAGADYDIIRTNVDSHDWEQIEAYVNAVLEVKTRYGVLTFIGLAIYCLTGARVCIQAAGTAICSGFVCDALTRAGIIWPRPPFAMMPGDIAQYFAWKTVE